MCILNKGKLLITGKPIELETQLPFEVLEVKARPRITMRNATDKTRGVDQWRPVGDRLRLFVREPNETQTEFENNLKKEGAEIILIRKTRKSMEDVFIYLAEHERRHETDHSG